MIHSDSQIWRGANDSPPDAAAATLDMMPPADLPTELNLDAGDADEMRRRLTEFLSALGESDPATRRDRVAALLARLDTPEAPAPALGPTNIPAARAEVDEFDAYFMVRRVRGDRTAETLLRGLFQTSAAILSLAVRMPGLPAATLERQLDGFALYARLLGRVCGLGELR